MNYLGYKLNSLISLNYRPFFYILPGNFFCFSWLLLPFWGQREGAEAYPIFWVKAGWQLPATRRPPKPHQGLDWEPSTSKLLLPPGNFSLSNYSSTSFSHWINCPANLIEQFTYSGLDGTKRAERFAAFVLGLRSIMLQEFSGISIVKQEYDWARRV